MATVAYNIIATEGDNWNGSFSITNLSGTIALTRPISASVSPISFIVNQFAQFDEYITWRSVDISAEISGPPNFLDTFPTTGYSIDIWCPSLISDINSDKSWNFLDGKSYSLNPNKNTLIYDYDTMNAVYYAKGGTLTFSVI
jgi:hypothetical protein